MGTFKVRFNLGRGDNYKKWKITDSNKNHFYLDPTKVQLWMGKAILKNSKEKASKIYNGAHKRVCAWVECESLIICHDNKLNQDLDTIHYNPKVNPFWTLHDKDVDNESFEILVTENNRIKLLK